RCTVVPGRAVASSTARKVACAARTGSENAAATMSAFSSHQREELDLGGGRLLGLCGARGAQPLANRREQHAFERLLPFGALHQRVAIGDQLRLLLVAAEHIAEADLAGRKLHGGARDRDFADIEWRAVAADAAAHHHKAAFGLAQLVMLR